MAVTRTHLTDDFITTNASSYTTATISPSAGRLLLVTVVGSHAAAWPGLTVSGCGVSWVQVASNDDTELRGAAMFRAMGTPTTGALTIATADVSSLTACGWSVDEYAGVDTSGSFGSGAIVQTRVARGAGAASVSQAFSGTVTAGNATVAAVGMTAINETTTPGTGWTQIVNGGISQPSTSRQVEWAATAQQNVTASWTTSADWFLVAAEIKSGSGGGSLNKLRIGDSIPSAIRVGDSTVSKVYLGDTQLWP
jgi:hypothetical protein